MQAYRLSPQKPSVAKGSIDHVAHASRTANHAPLTARELAQDMLDSIGDGVISSDIDGKVMYLNPVAERLIGWSREEATGRTFAEVFPIIDGDTRKPFPDPMKLAIQEDATVGLSVNLALIRRDGFESAIEGSAAPIHDQEAHVIGSVMVFRDASKGRVMNLKLSHLAQHDFLTDLPNRMLLNDRLGHAIALARRHRKRVAVLFLDLDRFKHVNDSLGHAIGDGVLQSVGNRLVAAVRGSDTVSRLGGDEFVVVLSDVQRPENAARHAEKIHAALSAPHAIAQRVLQVNVSIGISMFPDDGQDAESLIKRADAAMYRAKESGRNNYKFSQSETKRSSVRAAIAQPQFSRAPKRSESLWQTRLTVSVVPLDASLSEGRVAKATYRRS